VHYFEAMVIRQSGDANVLLEKRHLVLIVLKELNELLRLNGICSDFEDCER
jgi:hypothetical protein